MTTLVALLVASLASFLVWRFLNGDTPLTKPGAGVPKLKPGARIVDVRTPAQYRTSHLQGAINVPVQALSKRQAELGPQDGQVVVYCNSGASSAKAAELLRNAGFSDVVDGGAMRNLSAPAGDQTAEQGAPANRQQRRMQQRAQRRQR